MSMLGVCDRIKPGKITAHFNKFLNPGMKPQTKELSVIVTDKTKKKHGRTFQMCICEKEKDKVIWLTLLPL